MRDQTITTPTFLEPASSTLRVVHSKARPKLKQSAITKNLTGPINMFTAPIYYASSYTPDGPGGNYQGL